MEQQDARISPSQKEKNQVRLFRMVKTLVGQDNKSPKNNKLNKNLSYISRSTKK